MGCFITLWLLIKILLNACWPQIVVGARQLPYQNWQGDNFTGIGANLNGKNVSNYNVQCILIALI